MFREIQIRGHRYWLAPRGRGTRAPLLRGEGNPEVVRFRNAQEAFGFFRPLALDTIAMHSLRHLASHIGMGNLSNSGDLDVLSYLATEIARQRLTLLRRRIPQSSATASKDTRQGSTPAPRMAAPVAASRGEDEREPDPPTFGPVVAQDVQAATLIAASVAGVPFCEECEKTARAA